MRLHCTGSTSVPRRIFQVVRLPSQMCAEPAKFKVAPCGRLVSSHEAASTATRVSTTTETTRVSCATITISSSSSIVVIVVVIVIVVINVQLLRSFSRKSQLAEFFRAELG